MFSNEAVGEIKVDRSLYTFFSKCMEELTIMSLLVSFIILLMCQQNQNKSHIIFILCNKYKLIVAVSFNFFISIHRHHFHFRIHGFRNFRNARNDRCLNRRKRKKKTQKTC